MMTGETVYVDETAIDDVLVSTSGYNKGAPQAVELTDEVGPISDFTLYFPCDYDGDLLHKKITVRGIECNVINAPAHEEPARVFGSWVISDGFGKWDMVVYANRTRPEYAESIKVYVTTYKRDSLGNRSLDKSTKLYDGVAQVRMSNQPDETSETSSTVSTKTRATYYFVFPYVSGIEAYDTQYVTIEYNGETFDVESIENIDEKGEKTSIRAVRHG